MPVARATIIRGPATVTYNGISFYSKGDVKLSIKPKKIPNLVWNQEIDNLSDDFEVEVTLVPVAAYVNANIAVLYPRMNPVFGTSIVGSTDLPLVIHGKDGRKVTLAAAAILKMPKLTLTATKQIFGEMTFRGVWANNTARTTAGAMLAEASETYTQPALARSAILQQPYTAVWGGSAPWSAIVSEAGIEIDFDEQIEEQKADDVGVIDLICKDLHVTAKFVPLGPTAAQLLALANLQMARGASFITAANDLVITGADTTSIVSLYSANMEDESSLMWDTINKRVGQVMFRTSRPIASGALGPIFNLAAGS
jgi:PPE-repeat protein